RWASVAITSSMSSSSEDNTGTDELPAAGEAEGTEKALMAFSVREATKGETTGERIPALAGVFTTGTSARAEEEPTRLPIRSLIDRFIILNLPLNSRRDTAARSSDLQT
ncbi:hypothetical protein ABG067_008194, partial [Albugo candida]